MPTEKTPRSARVVALNEDGSVRDGGITPLGECGKPKPLDWESSKGVKLTDVFDMIHAGARDVRARLDTADLPCDEFFETFEALIAVYEKLIAIAVHIETHRR